jgi:hypothetical protein
LAIDIVDAYHREDGDSAQAIKLRDARRFHLF